jgi:pyruvate/2-oxoglutarate dehydrogenase complex dihydrolipoamide acyltransferase (E2) component
MSTVKQRGGVPVKPLLIAAGAVVVVGVAAFVVVKMHAPVAAPAQQQAAPAMNPQAAPPVAQNNQPAPAAAAPSAGGSYLASLQASGTPMKCSVDTTKLSAASAAAAAQAAAVKSTIDLSPPQVTVYILGKKMRSESVSSRVTVVSIIDADAGTALVKSTDMTKTIAAEGPNSAYANCEWFSYSLSDMAKLPGQSASTSSDAMMSASKDAYNCQPDTFTSAEFMPTGKVCDGKAFACDKLKSLAASNPAIAQAFAKQSPAMASFCGL